MDELMSGLKPGDRIRITGLPAEQGGPGAQEYTYTGYEPPKEGETEFRIYLEPITGRAEPSDG